MPEPADSDKAALSTAIRAVRVTLAISGASSGEVMAVRFVDVADKRFVSPLTLRDPDRAPRSGWKTLNAFAVVIA